MEKTQAEYIIRMENNVVRLYQAQNMIKSD